jgi:hypothetical protein
MLESASRASPPSPYDQAVETTVEIAFETLNQQQFLKPTQVYRYGETAGARWWQNMLGRSFSEYYLEHFIGSVLTYLRIQVLPVKLMPQQILQVKVQSLLGKYPPAMDKPPRYGGQDILTLATEGGETVARLWGYWLWFHFPMDGGKPGTLTAPPPVFTPVERTLEAQPAMPEAAGDKVQSFVWTLRETDLNRHATSLAYLERAENAAADAGVALNPVGTSEIWYLKPGFSGQRMDAWVEPGEGETRVRLASSESGATSTILRLPKG